MQPDTTEAPSTLIAPRPQMQAPAAAVAATSGAAFNEAVALTRKLKLPHIHGPWPRSFRSRVHTAPAGRHSDQVAYGVVFANADSYLPNGTLGARAATITSLLMLAY
ncbi:hypothetical protein [Streptomyces clavifer]|uniref:hypothetical protein n=1 Tax=Streptomyces clavifer TaxID=68188 RepID=UPI0036589287